MTLSQKLEKIDLSIDKILCSKPSENKFKILHELYAQKWALEKKLNRRTKK